MVFIWNMLRMQEKEKKLTCSPILQKTKNKTKKNCKEADVLLCFNLQAWFLPEVVVITARVVRAPGQRVLESRDFYLCVPLYSQYPKLLLISDQKKVLNE